MPLDLKAVLADIDRVLREAENVRTESHQVPRSSRRWIERDDDDRQPRVSTTKSTEDLARANLLLSSAISRYAAPGSPYLKQMDAILDKCGTSNEYGRQQLAGVLKGVRFEYENGSLGTIGEMIHRDLFVDFLDMARHLLDQGYKDPAAVVSAGVFEQHLRQLALKHGLPLSKENGVSRSAEALNEDLSKTGAYDSATQKEVTAKLAFRNQAAHAEWDKYGSQQVALFIDWVRFFSEKFPA